MDEANEHVISVWDLGREKPHKITETKVWLTINHVFIFPGSVFYELYVKSSQEIDRFSMPAALGLWC